MVSDLSDSLITHRRHCPSLNSLVIITLYLLIILYNGFKYLKCMTCGIYVIQFLLLSYDLWILLNLYFMYSILILFNKQKYCICKARLYIYSFYFVSLSIFLLKLYYRQKVCTVTSFLA